MNVEVSVMMKYSTYTCIWCRPLSQHPQPPARHRSSLLIPSPKQSTMKKAMNLENEVQLPTNCIILSCPNCMLFNISKQTFLKLPSQIMPLSGVRIGVVTPKSKTKSNPLAGQKVRILSKSLVSF